MAPTYWTLDPDGIPVPLLDVDAFEAALTRGHSESARGTPWSWDLADDAVGDARVRTVFAGIRRGGARTQLWETSVLRGGFSEVVGRYESRDQALAGHNAVVCRLQERDAPQPVPLNERRKARQETIRLGSRELAGKLRTG